RAAWGLLRRGMKWKSPLRASGPFQTGWSRLEPASPRGGPSPFALCGRRLPKGRGGHKAGRGAARAQLEPASGGTFPLEAGADGGPMVGRGKSLFSVPGKRVGPADHLAKRQTGDREIEGARLDRPECRPSGVG